MFVLYHTRSRPTGRVIARMLDVPSGRENRRGVSPMIRWGSAIEHRADTFLNQREAILRASNKLITLRKLQEAGVPVPPWSSSPTGMEQGVWFGRSFHGSQGRDIVVYQDGVPRDVRHDFYTHYIPNTREYRVHVFRDKVIRVQGKYRDFPEQNTNVYVKNHEQGFRFRAPRMNLRSDRIEAALKAVAALGLDFGAVDLLIGEDRRTYVLEVNSAPRCSPRTASAYVAEFVRVIQAELGMELRPQYDALAVLAPDRGE
jgi:glutathione synthase/RimK-type ligase-like ATP-grasp enzyme